MNKQDLYDLIESYLDNTLPETQRREVERRMTTDDAFRREVELHRELQARFNDPFRLQLRANLANIVKERNIVKGTLKHKYPMKKLYNYYVQALGERPTLVLVFLLLVSVLLYYRLVYFVSEAPRGIFGITLEESTLLMGGAIALVCCVLLWRLTVADQTLRKMVLDKYREAVRLVDSKAKATVRDLAGRLGIRINLYSKLLRLITLAPEPFIALVFFLAFVNILLYVALRYLPDGPEHSVWEDIYVNTPWAFATLVFIYVIYNDIKIMENLKRLANSITVKKFADFFAHIEKFREQLTRTELNMLDNLILYQHLSDKEIALLIKADTADVIKTHRFNILKKWGQYAANNNIYVPLEKLLMVFYTESSYNRTLPDDLKNSVLN